MAQTRGNGGQAWLAFLAGAVAMLAIVLAWLAGSHGWDLTRALAEGVRAAPTLPHPPRLPGAPHLPDAPQLPGAPTPTPHAWAPLISPSGGSP